VRPSTVRSPRRVAVAASCLLLSVGFLSGCGAGGVGSNPGRVSRPTSGPGETTVRVLQLNLCNSGRAGCYSGGRAVSMATALIRDDLPDVVTLNEVCRDDVRVLERALSTASGGAAVVSAFRSAVDRSSQAPVRCQNGRAFGDGVLAAAPSAAPGSRDHGGLYPVQDPDDVEERVWVCIDLATRLVACTTHTASTSASVALGQCRYLLGSAVPMVRGEADEPIVLGADLNLAATGSPNPDSCLPPGYRRIDDGALQDVVASPGLAIRSRTVIDMRGTTDHPALLVDLERNSGFQDPEPPGSAAP